MSVTDLWRSSLLVRGIGCEEVYVLTAVCSGNWVILYLDLKILGRVVRNHISVTAASLLWGSTSRFVIGIWFREGKKLDDDSYNYTTY